MELKRMKDAILSSSSMTSTLNKIPPLENEVHVGGASLGDVISILEIEESQLRTVPAECEPT